MTVIHTFGAVIEQLSLAQSSHAGPCNKSVNIYFNAVVLGNGNLFTFWKRIKYKYIKVSKGAKIRNRYNQVPHLTQDTNGKVTGKLTVNTTNESQEVSPFPAGDHKAHINRRAQRQSLFRLKHKTAHHQSKLALKFSFTANMIKQ